jgi:hypothetical protein
VKAPASALCARREMDYSTGGWRWRTAPESFSQDGWQNYRSRRTFKTAMWRTAGYRPHTVRIGDFGHSRLGPARYAHFVTVRAAKGGIRGDCVCLGPPALM